ncbi:hypothetical protein IT774_15725 [Salinimonas marina]|uniref:Protein kinase domain-containing protein n=1 Tax=Salinimonas marina TaxID=2785918 RepID=A0A7S9DX95_9ALTE|nr:YrbL family protein [Salinimonas marina]QPG05522.1 hypothetical protein IT774_15725 [Salinimonas marina]
MSEPLQLTSDLLLSSGSNRACYYHPYDANLCVKVLHKDSPRKTQTREINYFRFLKRRNIASPMVANLMDVVPTSRGTGVVFELVRDADGQVAKTVGHYLRQDDPDFNRMVVDKLDELIKHLVQQNIIFRDLITENVMLRRTGNNEYLPVVVDGIGHNDFLPLCDYFKVLGRRKNLRKWNREKYNWFNEFAVREEIVKIPKM